MNLLLHHAAQFGFRVTTAPGLPIMLVRGHFAVTYGDPVSATMSLLTLAGMWGLGGEA